MFTHKISPVLALSAAVLFLSHYTLAQYGSSAPSGSNGGSRSGGYSSKEGSNQKMQNMPSSQNSMSTLEMMISQMMSQPSSRPSINGGYNSGSGGQGGGQTGYGNKGSGTGGYGSGGSSMPKPMPKSMPKPSPMPASKSNTMSMMIPSYGGQSSGPASSSSLYGASSYKSAGSSESSGTSKPSKSSGYSGPSVSSGYEMPIRAAVMSTHSVEHRDVPIEPSNIQPQTILVEAMNLPLNILFQSKSSALNLQTEHVPSQGSTQETSSEDEPQILIHRVTKPIIQEVRELITPYRRIYQEIKPVEETVKTIVARAMPSDNKYEAVQSSNKYGSGSGYGGGNAGSSASMYMPSMPSKYGNSNSMGYQPQQQQQQPKNMQTNEQMLSQMMKALKMEIPKQFLQMGGYSYSPPAASSGAKSRMQMYMSQIDEPMNKRQQLQQQQEEDQQSTYEQESEGGDNGLQMMLPTGSNKGESLPLVLSTEPDLKGLEAQDEHQQQQFVTEEVNLLGEEHEVTASGNSQESSTLPTLTSEKPGSTIMIYTTGSMQQQQPKQQNQQQKQQSEKGGQSKSTTASSGNGASKLGLVQNSFLQSSNAEPSGY